MTNYSKMTLAQKAAARKYNRERYYELVSLGRCVTCKQPSKSARIRCDECRRIYKVKYYSSKGKGKLGK